MLTIVNQLSDAQLKVEGRAALGASLSNAMLELGGKDNPTSPR